MPATNAPLATASAKAQAERRKLFPTSTSIAALTAEQQDQLLQAIEKTGFFDLIRTHIVLGFFGSPGYGGNRNEVGWKLIGLEDRASFQPPGALCAGLFEHPLNEYKSVQVTRVLHDFYDSDPKRGFYGGGGIESRVVSLLQLIPS